MAVYLSGEMADTVQVNPAGAYGVSIFSLCIETTLIQLVLSSSGTLFL